MFIFFCLFYNYSTTWGWLVFDIYCAGKRCSKVGYRSKLLTNDTVTKTCLGVYYKPVAAVSGLVRKQKYVFLIFVTLRGINYTANCFRRSQNKGLKFAVLSSPHLNQTISRSFHQIILVVFTPRISCVL